MTAVVAAARGSGEAAVAARRRLFQWALLVAPAAFFAVQGWRNRWMLDDGFINLRVVRQLEAGNGPVFNAGERVEAFTSPLWIVIVAIGDVLTPARTEWVPVVCGIVAGTAGLALATAGGVRMARLVAPSATLVPVGVLIPATMYAFWALTTGGLEGGLSFAWEGACFFVLARWASDRERLLGAGPAVVLGLGWVIRPDLVVLTVVLLGVVLFSEWRRRSWPGRLALVAAVLAVPAAYQLFRMGYYGALLPNTAFAKEASQSLWGRGWDYLTHSFRPYWIWVPLLGLAVAGYPLLQRGLARAGERRAQLVVGAFAVAGLLMGAYMVKVGGDYVATRLLLPSLFALSVPIAVLPLERAYGAVLAVVLPWAFVSAVWLRPDVPYSNNLEREQRRVTAEQVLGRPVSEEFAWFRGPGLYWENHRLDVEPAPELGEATVSRLAIGMTGFAMDTDVHVFDTLGLADPLTSRFEAGEGGIAGHEKRIPPVWSAARLVAPGEPVSAELFPENAFVLTPRLIPTTSGAEFDRQVDVVREVLRCRPVDELADAARADMTVGRFLSNIVHSVRTFRTTIPGDPDEARRELC